MSHKARPRQTGRTDIYTTHIQIWQYDSKTMLKKGMVALFLVADHYCDSVTSTRHAHRPLLHGVS